MNIIVETFEDSFDNDVIDNGLNLYDYNRQTAILDETLWKDIPGFPSYEAHPEGEIRNKKNKRIFNNESKQHKYKYVMLNKKSVFVHRIIALTFHPNPLNLPEVNHIDNNRRNNRADNLEWISHSDNVKQAVEVGRKVSIPTRKSAIRITLRNGISTEYSSLEEAATKMDIKRAVISTCLGNDGLYCGAISSSGKREDKWLWKVERINTGVLINESVEEKRISIEGFTDFIACSDGKILNKDRKSIGSIPDGHYIRVKGKDISKAIHILIALTFIANPENKPYVNHKDGNKTNNAVSNLEWVTQKENMAHAKETGLINDDTLTSGIESRKIAVYQLELDGTIIKKFNSIDEASEITGSRTAISAVCSCYLGDKQTNRMHYSSAGFGWCYIGNYSEPKINGFFKKVFPELEGVKGIDYNKIRKYVDSGSRPVWQIEIDGSRIKLWESCQEIEKVVPMTTVAAIWISMNSNMTKICGGFYWRQASYDEIINPNANYCKIILEPVRIAIEIPAGSNLSLRLETVKLLHENTGEDGSLYIRTKPIVQMMITGEFIRNWSSPEKARHTLNLGRNNIEQVLKGRQQTACGYKWRHMTLEELCIHN